MRVLKFERGTIYSRPEVKERAGLPRSVKGGNWDTGVVEHREEFLIFANVDTAGRTGHQYANRWEGDCFRWYHKAGSNLVWRSVQRLLEPGRIIHVFWRTSNKSLFFYAGNAAAVEVRDTSPVEILWDFATAPAHAVLSVQSPEEIPRGTYREGAVSQVLVNIYERNRAARQVCIAHYGLACTVCGLMFEKQYGELGAGFIHVHHVIPLSSLGPEYELDPIQDVRPVCPNCHAMIHRQRVPLSIETLREIIAKRPANSSGGITQGLR